MIYPDVFFVHYYLILAFRVGRGVKGQKIAQNEQWKFNLSCTISHEHYSIGS